MTSLDELVESVSDDIMHRMDVGRTKRKVNNKTINKRYWAIFNELVGPMDVPHDVKCAISDLTVKRMRSNGLAYYQSA